MEFLGLDNRELAGDVQKGFEGDWMNFFFLDRTPLQYWVRCPLRDSTEEGQYFATLARVSPRHKEKLPAWMAEIQVDFTWKPAAACR